jgi:hypothetical protein
MVKLYKRWNILQSLFNDKWVIQCSLYMDTCLHFSCFQYSIWAIRSFECVNSSITLHCGSFHCSGSINSSRSAPRIPTKDVRVRQNYKWTNAQNFTITPLNLYSITCVHEKHNLYIMRHYSYFEKDLSAARKNENRSIHPRGCIYQKRVAQIPAAKTIGSCTR